MRWYHCLTAISIFLAVCLAAGCAAAPRKADPVPEVPWQAYWYFARGDLLELQGRPRQALDEYLLALKYDPGSLEPRLAAARVMGQLGGWKEAAGILEQTVQQAPASVQAYLLLGTCYMQLRRPLEAEKTFQRILRLDPDHIPTHKQLAALYEWQEDYARANEHYQMLLPLVKRPENMRLHRGDNFIRMKQYRQAQKEYLQALEIREDLTEGHRGVARTYELLGQSQQAVATYRTAIEWFPQQPALRRYLAELLVRLDRPEEALEQYRFLTEADSSDQTSLRHLALLLYHTEQYGQARDIFDRLAILSPDDPVVHLYLGRSLAGLGETDAAMEQFSRAIALDRELTEGWISLGISHLQMDDLEGAEDVLERSVLSVSDDPRLWHLLGACHLRMEKYQLAVGDLEKATSLDRANIGILRDLANSYERAGYFQKAVDGFGELLNQRPDDHWAMNYLGYMLADAGVQLPRARDLLERAVQLDPENAYYLDSLGWVYFRLGQTDLAERYLLEAAQRSPDQAVIHEHLGDLYQQEGRIEQARDRWRRALELNPGDQNIQRKLQQHQPEDGEHRP